MNATVLESHTFANLIVIHHPSWHLYLYRYSFGDFINHEKVFDLHCQPSDPLHNNQMEVFLRLFFASSAKIECKKKHAKIDHAKKVFCMLTRKNRSCKKVFCKHAKIKCKDRPQKWGYKEWLCRPSENTFTSQTLSDWKWKEVPGTLSLQKQNQLQ